MKTFTFLTLPVAAYLSMAGLSQAATISIETDEIGAASTSGISGYTTSGADMDGMQITGTFEKGATRKATFLANSAKSGVADGGWFSLSLDGTSSFSSPFVVAVTQGRLQSLQIDGVPGDTIFDIISASVGTSGSAYGRGFTTYDKTPGEVSVLFSRPISLTDMAHAGDLYGAMTVDFTGLGGLAAGRSFSFIQDTDNTAISGDFTPAVALVPLPAGFFLCLTALSAVGMLRRKANRTSPQA
ncbi:hypothetical protein [uncultured Roseobacter sp.]|uniref:hypothetical protein n=1 Tax=uncultured Roseobacter sp. TaxID=114847 RepID=UPI00261078B9|nr:hypothetical protein [uncultured Roseobacter sp.]